MVKINENKYSYFALLLSVSSCLYINLLPISPVYILTVLLMFFISVSIKIGNKDFFLFSILLLFLIVFTVFQAFELSNVSMLINTYLSFFVFFYLYVTLNKLDNNEIMKIARKYILCCALIVSFETIYRFLNPIYLFLDNLSGLEVYMYPFKRNSPMFIDSNYTSILLITNLILFNLGVVKFKHNKFLFFFVLSLLILTLSRASILSYITISICLLLLDYFRNNKLLVLVFSSSFVVVLLFYYFIISSGSIAFSDGSLNSKFNLLNMMFDNFYNNGPIFLLFGGGIGNAGVYLNGIGAHNIFVLMFTEYGLLFALFILLFVLFSIKETKWKILPFWLVMLLSGQALGFFFAFVFIPMAFCMSFYKDEL